MAAGRAEALRGGSTLNQKDLKRFKKILEESKKNLLLSARKTLSEEAAFDTDDLPDEIDLASSEYTQSMVFRLRDREKFLLGKISGALERLEAGKLDECEDCGESIGFKRLLARPVTTFCIDCKEEREKEEQSQAQQAGRSGAVSREDLGGTAGGDELTGGTEE